METTMNTGQIVTTAVFMNGTRIPNEIGAACIGVEEEFHHISQTQECILPF